MAALQKIPAPELLHLFIQHLRGERRLAEKTCEAYTRDISEFLGFLARYLEKPITLPDIVNVEARGFRAYLAQRRRGNRPLSAASVQRHLSAVRTFYRYIERRWDAANSALPLIRGPRVKRPLPKAVSAAEALKIIDTPLDSPGEPWIAARNQAVLALCYGSGLRISEALSLTGRDMPLQRQIQLTGKGNKTRLQNICGSSRFNFRRINPFFAAPVAVFCGPKSFKPKSDVYAALWDCPKQRRRMLYVIALRRTFSRAAAIYGQSNNSSAMRASRRRSAIRMLMRRG